MAFRKLIYCLACSSKNLKKVLNLNKQPLANSYLKEKNLKEKKYELKVNCCLNCSHLQLSLAVDPKIIYTKYDYVSGTTITYKNYMKDFFKLCLKNTNQLKYKNILDIGCNDGSLLNYFKKKGAKTVGVEPTNAALEAKKNGHFIYQKYFDDEVSGKIKKNIRK